MSNYVDASKLKKSLTLTGTTFADYDIEAAIPAASDAVNEMCGRYFDRDITATVVRYYRPQSPTVILIDDLFEIVTLETDQDGDFNYERLWVENLEYVLSPYNAIADNFPYTKISLNTYRTSTGFPSWIPRSVKLTGKFGWPVLPSAVPEAAQLLASKLIKLIREAPFGIVTVGLDTGSAVRIARTDPIISGMLAPYVREKIVDGSI